MEKRTSPRTRINAMVKTRSGTQDWSIRCTELSQTGLLLSAPRAVRTNPWPYLSAQLMLPNGPVHLRARRVGVRGDKVAYCFIVLDDASQDRLTDFLFDLLYEETVPATKRRRLLKPAA